MSTLESHKSISFLLYISDLHPKTSTAFPEMSVTGYNAPWLYVMFKFIVGKSTSLPNTCEPQCAFVSTLCFQCGHHHRSSTLHSQDYEYSTMTRMIVTEYDRLFSTSLLSPPREPCGNGAVDEAEACVQSPAGIDFASVPPEG